MKNTYKLLLTILLLSFSFNLFAEEKPTAIYVKIKKAIMPIERGEKFEDPLNEALQAKHLGEVMGGGSMLNKDGSIEFVGIDVDLTNLNDGIPFLKSKLIELGVPEGTTIEYEFFNNKVVETVK
ncbi:hypothetical protein [Methylotenera sp. N17]|uniref:hypothetical protein n=1 Tax=Methylotenera sp. N17 TaxID=1502761 RepID=UPI000689A6FA|nr:hypothetical protein [Methylotenera sp. N17]